MGQNKSKSKELKPKETLVQVTSLTNSKQSDAMRDSPQQSEKMSNDTQATSSSQQRRSAKKDKIYSYIFRCKLHQIFNI
jgi:hypothetical protein